MSRLLRDRSLVEKLRATESADALYALLVETRSGAERGVAASLDSVDERRLELVLADQRLRDLDESARRPSACRRRRRSPTACAPSGRSTALM